MRAPLLCLVIPLALLLASACEPEVGMPCSADEEYVLSRVEVEPGKNDLVRDINFENCTQFLCLSANGSRPYCTRQCETDLDCAAEGFTCQEVVHFGPLACADWTPEQDCVRPDGTPSEQPLRYCYAPPEVIEDRDRDFGRAN